MSMAAPMLRGERTFGCGAHRGTRHLPIALAKAAADQAAKQRAGGHTPDYIGWRWLTTGLLRSRLVQGRVTEIGNGLAGYHAVGQQRAAKPWRQDGQGFHETLQ